MTAALPAVAALLVIAALAASASLTGLIRRLAMGSGVLDYPNARSLHSAPTPRGGGVAIVAVTTGCLIALGTQHAVRPDLVYALAGGGLAVAWVGLADDRRSLSATTRLTVHFAAALWALFWLGGLPALRVGSHLVSFGWGGYLLGALGIVWAINLFNFMDGVDGIAASEAIFVAVAGGMLTTVTGNGAGMALVALVFAAACGGFLVWNTPPARIFLGDVGSAYLGYVIAVLAVAATRENPLAIWVWLILGGAFFVDATGTLLRRLWRRERVFEAHRSHTYQHLARRWQSHGKVTVAVLAVNVLWLLPCAVLVTYCPRYAAVMVLVALVPISLLAQVAVSRGGDAGRPPLR